MLNKRICCKYLGTLVNSKYQSTQPDLSESIPELLQLPQTIREFFTPKFYTHYYYFSQCFILNIFLKYLLPCKVSNQLQRPKLPFLMYSVKSSKGNISALRKSSDLYGMQIAQKVIDPLLIFKFNK